MDGFHSLFVVYTSIDWLIGFETATLLQGPHPDIFRVSNDAAWMNGCGGQLLQQKCWKKIIVFIHPDSSQDVFKLIGVVRVAVALEMSIG